MGKRLASESVRFYRGWCSKKHVNSSEDHGGDLAAALPYHLPLAIVSALSTQQLMMRV